jgi:phosphohistidine phosphatase
MRTLILMRHSKAEAAGPGQSDESRVLTGRGRREAAEAGAALKAEGYKPDLILVSTSARTRETAAGAFEANAPLQFEAELYHAAPRAVWKAFSATDAASVAIIAHNPGLAELVAHLVRDARDQSLAARAAGDGFPTSAWAAFEIRGETFEAPGARFLRFRRPIRD